MASCALTSARAAQVAAVAFRSPYRVARRDTPGAQSLTIASADWALRETVTPAKGWSTAANAGSESSKASVAGVFIHRRCLLQGRGSRMRAPAQWGGRSKSLRDTDPRAGSPE